MVVVGWQWGYRHRVARGVAVAGCGWYQSIAEVEAVRMVVVRAWQWQYWQRYGCLYNMQKKCNKKWWWLGGSVDTGIAWQGEWQWRGGSGTIRKRRLRRFEWYQIEGGRGGIGRAITIFQPFVSMCGHFSTIY
jgi:hypothetical protein